MTQVIDRNIVKFGLYGFLKNLKLFEPFFYLYLLSIGLSYFQIGLILSVRELSAYVFEIPTGVVADLWGRKKTMLLCFALYSLSFAMYYVAHAFWLLIPASLLFGLGDALRLGTHKAIIFDYLDDTGKGHLRTRVYGFTRALSQVGLALSALGAGGIVLWRENYHAGFLFSIIPYLLAFGLVLTYPSSSHEASVNRRGRLWERLRKHLAQSLTALRKVKNLRLALVNSAIYDGAFKAGKDYIQPLLQSFVLAAAAPGTRIGADGRSGTVLISAFYLLIYLLSAVSAQKAYKVEELFKKPEKALNVLFLSNVALFCGTGLFAAESLPIVFMLFTLLFVSKNLRRPMLLDYLTESVEPAQRATMLSVESQLRSLAVVVLAPVLGLVADVYSIGGMFLILAGLLAALYVFFLKF